MVSDSSRPASADDVNVLMMHMTQLASWKMRTLGKALLWSLLVPVVLGAVAIGTGDGSLLAIAALVGPAVFAFYLSTADAPVMPDD